MSTVATRNEGDETTRPWIEARTRADALVHVADLAQALTREVGLVASVVADARRDAAGQLARATQTAPGPRGRLRHSIVSVVGRAVTRAFRPARHRS